MERQTQNQSIKHKKHTRRHSANVNQIAMSQDINKIKSIYGGIHQQEKNYHKKLEQNDKIIKKTYKPSQSKTPQLQNTFKKKNINDLSIKNANKQKVRVVSAADNYLQPFFNNKVKSKHLISNETFLQRYSKKRINSFKKHKKKSSTHTQLNRTEKNISKITESVLNKITLENRQITLKQLKSVVKQIVAEQFCRQKILMSEIKTDGQLFRKNKKNSPKKHNQSMKYLPISKLVSIKSMNNSFYDPTKQQIQLQQYRKTEDINILKKQQDYDQQQYYTEISQFRAQSTQLPKENIKEINNPKQNFTKNIIKQYIQILKNQQRKHINISPILGYDVDQSKIQDISESMALEIEEPGCNYQQLKKQVYDIFMKQKDCNHSQANESVDLNQCQQQQSILMNADSQKLLAQLYGEIQNKILNSQNYDDILDYVYKRLQNKKNNLENVSDTNSKSSIIKLDTQQSNTSSFLQINQIKTMNFAFIQQTLSKRSKKLEQKRQKQLIKLYNQLEDSKLSYKQFEQQREKIYKWINTEMNEVLQVRKSVTKSFIDAKEFINKNCVIDDEKLSSTGAKIMKCLSEKYMAPLRQLSQNSQNSKDIKQIEKQNDQQQIQAIKQAVLKLRQVHSLQQSKKLNTSLQESDQQIIQIDISQDNIDDNDKNKLQMLDPTKNQILTSNKRQDKILIEDDMKDDIFEFVFLDLCVEILQQSNNTVILKKLKLKLANKQSKHSKRKGLKTDLSLSKQFLTQFHRYVVQNHSQQLHGFDIALGPTAQQILKYMHESDNSDDNSMVEPILSNQIFQQFEKPYIAKIQFNSYYDDIIDDQNRKQFLKNCLFIFHKSIFDALNEHLDEHRIFGKLGLPFPWKKQTKFPQIFDIKQRQVKLKQAFGSVYTDCAYMCGLIVDKQDSIFNGKNVPESYINEIRQDRVGRMMAAQLFNNEFRWLFYDDDQAEVMLQLSKIIQAWILLQLATQLIYL